jgi:hypothetical protein
MSGLIGGCCAGKKQGVARSIASAMVATCVGKTIPMSFNIVNLSGKNGFGMRDNTGGLAAGQLRSDNRSH